MFLHKEARVGTNQLTPLVISQLIAGQYKIALIPFAVEMQDQLHPRFIIIAFAFLFEFGVRSPDLRNRSQWRRDSNAPRIDFPHFAAALVRRIEGQFRRDWIFVFAAWNLIFDPRLIFLDTFSKEGFVMVLLWSVSKLQQNNIVMQAKQ